jgi:hypothetical protein
MFKVQGIAVSLDGDARTCRLWRDGRQYEMNLSFNARLRWRAHREHLTQHEEQQQGGVDNKIGRGIMRCGQRVGERLTDEIAPTSEQTFLFGKGLFAG